MKRQTLNDKYPKLDRRIVYIIKFSGFRHGNGTLNKLLQSEYLKIFSLKRMRSLYTVNTFRDTVGSIVSEPTFQIGAGDTLCICSYPHHRSETLKWSVFTK